MINFNSLSLSESQLHFQARNRSIGTIIHHFPALNKFTAGQLTPDASFLGKFYRERMAYAMSGGGDVNGDGFDDFLLGTFHNSVQGQDAGAVYLLLGRPAEQWVIHDSVSQANAIFYGERRFEAVGYSVANNGDLNGDGIDDILIGASAGNDKIRSKPGKVYIVLGRATADWGNSFILSDSANGAFTGENGQDLAGESVAIIGDVNGDGYEDFLVGAPEYDYPDMEASGKVYLVLGRSSGWALDKELASDSQASFILSRNNAHVGFSVAGAGDVNHDDIPDLLIGAPGISRSYVIFGRREVNWGKNFDLKQADLVIKGEQYGGERNGHCVRGAGDLNGDGIDDMLISAVHNRTVDINAGKVYVIFGKDAGWDTQEIQLSNADASYYGEDRNDLAGFCLSPVGDTNGDGFSDFIIGMFNDGDRDKPGKAWFIFGADSGWTFNTPLATIPDYFIGEQNGDLTGFCVSNAGDVDGDEWDDFLIAAPYNSQVDEWSGQVYLFRSKRLRFEISGKVTYFHSGLPVPICIKMNGNYDISDTTDSAGSYHFEAFGFSDYQISLSKTKDDDLTDDCITAYDAALAARHALHLATLEDNHWRAADVYFDSMVTMYDAALILHHVLEIPHEGISHAGEWSFDPSSRNYPALSEDHLNQDYICFVRGDVDASWQRPELSMTKPLLSYEFIKDTSLTRDQQFVLPIFLENSNAILSFEATIEYDPNVLRFSAVRKTELGANFFLEYNQLNACKIKIAAFTTQPVDQAGVYAKLSFLPIIENEGTGFIKIEKLRINGTRIRSGSARINFRQQDYTPVAFQLYQNYPNPFNSETLIQYALPSDGKVNLKIINILGQTVRTIFNKQQKAGRYQVIWDGKDTAGQVAPTGLYFYKLTTGDYVQIRKLALIR